MPSNEKGIAAKPATIAAIRSMTPEQCQQAARNAGWTVVDPDPERTREALLVYAARPRIQNAVRKALRQ